MSSVHLKALLYLNLSCFCFNRSTFTDHKFVGCYRECICDNENLPVLMTIASCEFIIPKHPAHCLTILHQNDEIQARPRVNLILNFIPNVTYIIQMYHVITAQPLH